MTDKAKSFVEKQKKRIDTDQPKTMMEVEKELLNGGNKKNKPTNKGGQQTKHTNDGDGWDNHEDDQETVDNGLKMKDLKNRETNNVDQKQTRPAVIKSWDDAHADHSENSTIKPATTTKEAHAPASWNEKIKNKQRAAGFVEDQEEFPEIGGEQVGKKKPKPETSTVQPNTSGDASKPIKFINKNPKQKSIDPVGEVRAPIETTPLPGEKAAIDIRFNSAAPKFISSKQPGNNFKPIELKEEKEPVKVENAVQESNQTGDATGPKRFVNKKKDQGTETATSKATEKSEADRKREEKEREIEEKLEEERKAKLKKERKERNEGNESGEKPHFYNREEKFPHREERTHNPVKEQNTEEGDKNNGGDEEKKIQAEERKPHSFKNTRKERPENGNAEKPKNSPEQKDPEGWTVAKENRPEKKHKDNKKPRRPRGENDERPEKVQKGSNKEGREGKEGRREGKPKEEKKPNEEKKSGEEMSSTVEEKKTPVEAPPKKASVQNSKGKMIAWD